MKGTKIMRRLRASLEDGRIITVVRDDYDHTMIDGLVIRITDDWIIMHELNDGVYLDAISMVRLGDISRVWYRDDTAYHHRAIAALGTEVATFECDDEVETADLLARASEGDAIFAIHLETREGEPMMVGRLTRLRNKSFDLHFVGRDGVWVDEADRWKYRDVTRIELGGRYLEALNRFADPYPVPLLSA